MKNYAGLDVSLKEVSICVIDEEVMHRRYLDHLSQRKSQIADDPMSFGPATPLEFFDQMLEIDVPEFWV